MKLTLQQKYMIGGGVLLALIGYAWWSNKQKTTALAATTPQQLPAPSTPVTSTTPPASPPSPVPPQAPPQTQARTIAYAAPIFSSPAPYVGPA